jgi:hypothetical protein
VNLRKDHYHALCIPLSAGDSFPAGTSVLRARRSPVTDSNANSNGSVAVPYGCAYFPAARQEGGLLDGRLRLEEEA